jgi:hypothetical protein
MIKKEQIYNATNNGLSILQYYYPQIREEYAHNRHKFKMRDETDASATLRLHEGCYRVTDFGGDGREKTPLDVVMEKENLSFFEACNLLADRYNLTEFAAAERMKPQRMERDALDTELDGDFFFEEREPTETELKLMGPGVTQAHFKNLHWHALASYTLIKDRKATTKTSTEQYPIFARECIFENEAGQPDKFYKLYQPLNDKQYRFAYYPRGKRPKNYINGLFELQQEWKTLNQDALKEIGDDPQALKAFKGKKKRECFICSGERDALTLYAKGYSPIWFNSETADIRNEDYNLLMKYAASVYNIPDIDDTGLRQGKALALRFLDMETIWLPQSLKKFKDWRGKPRKDFRDWAELHPSKQEFENLLNMALSAKFWMVRRKQNGDIASDIDLECFHYFMRLNNFFVFKDTDSDQYFYMQQQGQVIRKTTARDMKKFLKDWSRDRCLERTVRNVIIGSKVTDMLFEALDERVLQFRHYTKDSQIYFFENDTWRITAEGVFSCKDENLSCLEENVIRHPVHLLPPMFECTDADGYWQVDVKSRDSKYFCYLINSSRIYWRKELEDELDKKSEAEREDYKRLHKFDITSGLLDEAENREQMLCLASKIFTLGYYMHRYKTPSKAWAAYAMDWKMGENGENNGRSGKSFFFKFADIFMNRVKLSGRNKKLMDNQHVYDQVDKFTDFVLIDDCNQLITPDMFYDTITSDMNVNPKNTKSYTIPFEESPKFAFTTNYVPDHFDPSSVGRLLYLVFSDYYHIQTHDNGYRENREILSDFGKTLFTDYTEEEYNADINFFCQCGAFYLQCVSQNKKIQPDLTNIFKRSLKARMNESFEDWATGYFAPEGANCNRCIDKMQVFYACKQETGQPNMTSQRFMKQLRSFVELSTAHECLNPPELCGKSGRIIKTISGESREQLYVRTVGAVINQ